MQKLIRYGAALLLLGIVGYGFSISGSPVQNRKIAKDIDTLSELEQVHCLLQRRYTKDHAIPNALDSKELNGYRSYNYESAPATCKIRFCNVGMELQPSLHTRYHYTASSRGYKICAQFNSTLEDIRKNRSSYYYGHDLDWPSKIMPGENCFERTFEECKKETKE